jgi:2,3-bisphosphoglycerate-independent phosphoglycerate mutase
LKRIAEQVLASGGVMVVTSDHGNAEQMINPATGGVDTEHSTNQVPFIVVAKEFQGISTVQFPSGILADVAPTVLALMGISHPGTMVGHDLLGLKIENRSFE